MPQVFHHSTNLISRLTIYGFFLFVLVAALIPYWIDGSPYVTEANVPRVQPVPFSHKHHTAELGIDCRYCHTSVEDSSFAGLPPTETCMTCHSQIWKDSPMLEPVRESFRSDRSIQWLRVNALPQFVYFNHSIHISKGIGCTTCHGPIGAMPLTWAANSLKMEWCLECHRHPENNVRPKDQVFNIAYQPPPNQVELGTKLMADYKIRKLTDCYTCHR